MLSMQHRTFYRHYKFLEACTFLSDRTLIFLTGAAQCTGHMVPVHPCVADQGVIMQYLPLVLLSSSICFGQHK